MSRGDKKPGRCGEVTGIPQSDWWARDREGGQRGPEEKDEPRPFLPQILRTHRLTQADEKSFENIRSLFEKKVKK